MKALDNGIEIGELSKIHLEENDIVVFDFKDKTLNQESINNMYNNMKSIFPNNKILFKNNDVEIKIIEGRKDNE